MAYAVADADATIVSKKATVDLTGNVDWAGVIARCGQRTISEACVLAYKEAIDFCRAELAEITP